MALLISEILDDVSLESQKDFDFQLGTGDELALMVSWLNSTQKDLLHTGVYRHLLRRWTSMQNSPTTPYGTLSVNDVRRVDAVFDSAHNKFLSPLENLFPPSSIASPEDKPRSPRPPFDTAAFRSSGLSPEFYWVTTEILTGIPFTKIHYLPMPQTEHISPMWVYYTAYAPHIANATDDANLIIGQDGRDALLAGILWRMWSYYDQPEKAAMWKSVYDEARKGETE